MIKNIVFDIGNVLLAFIPREYLQKTYSDPVICGVLYDTIFASQEWTMLDRGTLTNEEAAVIFSERVPQYKKEIEHVMETCFAEVLVPIEETISTLKLLKEKGYNIFLLSNFNEKAFEYISSAYDFFKFVDGMTVSYRVHQLKPEPEIYKTLLDSYNLSAAETLFTDDVIENIRGAEAAGISCIHFTDYNSFARELAVLGIV